MLPLNRLELKFACGRYDRTEALRTGEITPEGIKLSYIPIQSPREIFERMVGGHEFDVSEFSTSEFITTSVTGNCPFVALPVFPSRMFRLGFIYVNRRSGIRTPKDLEGKRIGVPLYSQTAAIWIRGYLKDQHCVDLSTITWIQGAVDRSGRHGKPHLLPLLKRVNIEDNDTDYSLGELLALGKIDGLIGSRRPENLVREQDITRLFPDYRRVEREVFKQTRIFPIMHLLAVRRNLYEQNRWIAASLYKACVDAKNWALARLHFSGSPSSMLPWQFADVDEMDELFGDDPWPYGIEANRRTLETLVRYMTEQNVIARPIPVDQLFVPLLDATDD
jgi:4,5-dihydroxyphthalate decarboxylase